MASPERKTLGPVDDSSLPIPLWTEQEDPSRPHTPSHVSRQVPRKPLRSDDGLHVVPVLSITEPDGLQVVPPKPPQHPDPGLHLAHEQPTDQKDAPPPPYEKRHLDRCIVLPSRTAEWRVRGAEDRVKLSTLAAAVLVREGLLDGANVELIQEEVEEDPSRRDAGAAPAAVEKPPRDPLAALTTSTVNVFSELQRGASEAALRTYRLNKLASEDLERERAQQRRRSSSSRSSSSNGAAGASQPGNVQASGGGGAAAATAAPRPLDGDGEAGAELQARKKTPSGAEKLDRAAEAVASSGKGVARIVGVGLAAPGEYTHALARGFHNVPRLYGDETVRADDRIVGFTSGLAAAGKGFGYGLYDGITGFFVQPVKGAKEEGAKGFVKGVVKGVGGVVCKPAAGGVGLAGHTLVGIQRSIERGISRRPKDREPLSAAAVVEGEEEMLRLTDKEKDAIISAWFASTR
ncbi:hypothetical protein MPH_08378 [Macrophomina phaseolina MS6]|uniref:Uncharacterized protein n=1 Tax=Macrophomina phaseolina (strain MS6) TaxID=1126212 RepID=K2RW24_MACPH|nr:hypothetical protein MPH_08378 [Macrophomina phaseolina MS6]